MDSLKNPPLQEDAGLTRSLISTWTTIDGPLRGTVARVSTPRGLAIDISLPLPSPIGTGTSGEN